MMKSLVSLPLVASLLAACHHAPEAVPAALADDTQAVRTALAARLGEAIGRANVTLGAGDLTTSSTVSVLPPPLGEHETRSPATPSLFTLTLMGGDCYAVPENDGAPIALPDVPCRPL